MAHIGLVALLVSDYDAAIDFYVNALGFRLVEDTPLDEDNRWVVVAPPGARETGLLLAQAATARQRDRVGDQAGGRVGLFLRPCAGVAEFLGAGQVAAHGVRVEGAVGHVLGNGDGESHPSSLTAPGPATGARRGGQE